MDTNWAEFSDAGLSLALECAAALKVLYAQSALIGEFSQAWAGTAHHVFTSSSDGGTADCGAIFKNSLSE